MTTQQLYPNAGTDVYVPERRRDGARAHVLLVELAAETLAQVLHRTPTTDDLAGYLGVNEADVVKWLSRSG